MFSAIRPAIASVAFCGLAVAAFYGPSGKATDRLPTGGSTVVEKTQASKDVELVPGADPKQIQSFLLSQAALLDLRPWQHQSWDRYASALATFLATPTSLSIGPDPIVASSRFAEDVVARAPAATSLAAAASELRDQLRPEQIVRAASLIPPPLRLTRRAHGRGEPISVEASSPRPSRERETSRVTP